MSDLFVARTSGTVMLDGRRHAIRRGVTVAQKGSAIMDKHAKLFEPMRVHYPAPRRDHKPAPVEMMTAAPGERRHVAPAPESPPPAEHACDEPGCDATAKSPAGLAAHKRSHTRDT